MFNNEKAIGKRVNEIAKGYPYSVEELLGMMRAMADVCMIANVDTGSAYAGFINALNISNSISNTECEEKNEK